MTNNNKKNGGAPCLPAVRIQHLDWTLTVDFDVQILRATATYTLLNGGSDSTQLELDTNHLIIDRVYAGTTAAAGDGSSKKDLSHHLRPATPGKPHLGGKLVIDLPTSTTTSTAGGLAVSVAYRTTARSSALQWLTPSQTAGRCHPYMFTQCQAIHARSLVPCQDVTGVKFTYTCHITVPAWATAVLSAVEQSVETNTCDSTKTAVWKQDVPISSYLLAVAVGELERRELSERCAVYSEPAVVDAAAYEFAQTELFLQTAEQIAGTPYQWGRYDLLCLPPSFSYGGMENPNMTFVTPTLLAGDQSLANVVAHEIAHSWTGNYVTCATWNDFWLNEGWTVWLERKIASRLYGPKHLDFAAIGGYQSLNDAVKAMPEEFRSLVLPIGDLDPDDAYSVIAYEKGFNFLLYLERKVGTNKFEKFFQTYIKHFASKTLTSEEFREFLIQYFDTDEAAHVALQDVDWQTWYYTPGLPPTVVDYDRSLAEASEDLASKWVQVDTAGERYPLVSVDSWSSMQITCFLDALLSLTLSSQPLKLSTLHAINALYGFANSRNSEILLRYCRLAIAAEDESILPAALRFVTSQGRMKYIRPLYKALFESKMGKELAVETFLQHRDFYHPIGAKMVASDLMVKAEVVDEPKGECSEHSTVNDETKATSSGTNSQDKQDSAAVEDESRRSSKEIEINGTTATNDKESINASRKGYSAKANDDKSPQKYMGLGVAVAAAVVVGVAVALTRRKR